jgi:hypothetical protein
MRSYLKILVAAAVLVGTACSDDAGGPDGAGNGSLTVRLTDKPFPFSEVASVNMFVVRIDAKVATVTDDEAEDASDMDGWRTIVTPNDDYDLLDLQNGVTANLGTATLPTGTYKGFRLIIDPSKSSVTLTNGTVVDVMWPSAAQSGIKIKLDTDIHVTEAGSVMVLDFDVGRSFVMRGNSISQNGLLFKPVIRAAATDITGSISGVVRANLLTGAVIAGATVELLTPGSLLDDADPEHVLASTVTDANGVFTFAFVLPGAYVVRVTPPSGSAYVAALLVGGVTLTTSQNLTGVVVVLLPLP